MINQYPGLEECDQTNINEWLECDKNGPGYEVLADDEIIFEVQENSTDDEESVDEVDFAKKWPSHDEAFHRQETVML